jgi:hypothetical protein
MAAVRLLLEQGADPTARDRFGNTPIDDARRTQSNELILTLSDWAERRPSPPPATASAAASGAAIKAQR